MDAALNVSGMLRELADWGWKPVLHQATDVKFLTSTASADGWVCYPQAEVRAFYVGRGPDPGTAVLSLHQHARAHAARAAAVVAPAPEERTA